MSNNETNNSKDENKNNNTRKTLPHADIIGKRKEIFNLNTTRDNNKSN